MNADVPRDADGSLTLVTKGFLLWVCHTGFGLTIDGRTRCETLHPLISLLLMCSRIPGAAEACGT
jgi:hypothetical protein